MTKKIIALFLLIAVCLSAVSCGEKVDWFIRDVCPTKPYSGSLENGDTFYNSDVAHAVFDEDRTVLYFNDLLIAFTKTDLEEKEISDLAKSIDGEVVGVVKGYIHTVQFKVEATNLAGIEKLCKKLMKDDSVIYACPEYPVQIMSTETEDKNPWGNDTDDVLGDEENPAGYDWWAEAVRAYTAWEYIDMCQPINIGVIDCGVDANHEDLKGQITNINDYVINDIDHGTHVTGIMGALDNNVGIRGIASFADFYCADLWSRSDPKTTETFHTIGELMACYNYLLQKDVKVINNSWGCTTFTMDDYKNLTEGNTLEYTDYKTKRLTDLAHTAKAIIAMLSQIIGSGKDDVIFVTSAGNDSIDAKYSGFFSMVTKDIHKDLSKESDSIASYKEIDERIFIVAAMSHEEDFNDPTKFTPSNFTSYGETIDIFAPGTDIYSTANIEGSIYEKMSGTSMAAPIVCASIAYVWAIDPTMTVSGVRELILSTATTNIVLDEVMEKSGTTDLVVNLGNAVEALVDKLEK